MALLRRCGVVLGRRRAQPLWPCVRALSTTETKTEEPPSPPKAIGGTTTHSYQAETKSLLRIVSNALYTEREIFLRELVSNACDALEKARQKTVAGETLADAALELEIKISATNDEIVIEDTGIGMTRDELSENLGTIALSGSKKFVESLKETTQDASGIIGQFGVGFYSAFMVGDEVTVESKSFNDTAARWRSTDGAESYDLEDLEPGDLKRGTRVRIKLKEDAKEFLKATRLTEIVKKYSNFAPFPILVENSRANATDALWAKMPKDVTPEEYSAFYRSAFHGAWDKPSYTLHFRAEAPIDLKALCYLPSTHSERAGMGRIDPAISLYSRKVLIESPCRDLLPDWLRFIRGVVDSEDLPLSISREKSQDKKLLLKIRDVLVRKIIRFLQDKAKEDRDSFLTIYQQFQVFLKEGVCNDFEKQKDIAKLLYFDTSREIPAEEDDKDIEKRLTSLDEYISRLPSKTDDNDDGTIYYLYAPTRSAALNSPYFEPFKKTKRECLFVYNAIDDFVMGNLGVYNDRTIATAETYEGAPSSEEDKKKDDDTEEKKDDETMSTSGLDAAKIETLGTWMKAELEDKLESVEMTTKLTDSPAVLVDTESGAMRRMMSLISQQNSGADLPPLPAQKLLLNPKHPIVIALYNRVTAGNDLDLARDAAAQLLDNALIAAGLMDDPQKMLRRLNTLLKVALVDRP